MFSRSFFAALLIASLLTGDAFSATWTVEPDPCPVPAAAQPYAPEANIVSPDARDGLAPGEHIAPSLWPPAALTVEIPGGFKEEGAPIFLWFDREMLEAGDASVGDAMDCSAHGGRRNAE